MKPALQKRLALLGAALGIGVLIAANANLVKVAFESQPDCTLDETGPAPARRAC